MNTHTHNVWSPGHLFTHNSLPCRYCVLRLGTCLHNSLPDKTAKVINKCNKCKQRSCSSTVIVYVVSCDASCSAAVTYNSTTATQWNPTFCWQGSKSVYFSKSWSRVPPSNKINRFSQILRKHGYRFFLWTSVSPVIKSFGTEQSRPTSTNKCKHFYGQQTSTLVKSRPNAPIPPIFNVLTTVRVGLQISATWHVSSVVPRTTYHTRSNL